MKRTHPSQREHSRGVSLVEFMVSTTIGLLLMAAVIATISAVFETRARRAALERSHEALRFGAYTLMAKVRAACGIAATSTDSVLSLDTAGGAETITLAGNAITLNGQAIVDGINGLDFRYAKEERTDQIRDADYAGSSSIMDWAKVRSVKIRIVLEGANGSAGVEENFVATGRRMALGILSAPCP